MYIGGDTDITFAYLDLDDIKNFYSFYKEVADQHDPKFYPKYSFLPTNTLRIATPPRVLCMRVNTPPLRRGLTRMHPPLSHKNQ